MIFYLPKYSMCSNIITPSPEPATITNTPTESPLLSKEYAKNQYPTIFAAQVRSHIFLTDNARPFCVNTPTLTPFAYRIAQNFDGGKV